MNKRKSKSLALAAMFAGIIITFSLVLIFLTYIRIPGLIAAAPLLLLIIAVAGATEDLFVSVTAGTVFGLSSLVGSFVFPDNFLALAFNNPLISVVPRVALGFAIYFAAKFFGKVFKEKESDSPKRARTKKLISFGCAGGFGALFNTVTVLCMIAVFYLGRNVGETAIDGRLLFGIAALNGTIEFAVCIIITPLVLIPLKRIIKDGKKMA
jgi:uncharacterized membrane protein